MVAEKLEIWGSGEVRLAISGKKAMCSRLLHRLRVTSGICRPKMSSIYSSSSMMSSRRLDGGDGEDCRASSAFIPTGRKGGRSDAGKITCAEAKGPVRAERAI